MMRETKSAPRLHRSIWYMGAKSRLIPGFLERSVAHHGDSTAVIFMNRRMSYRQLKEEVDRFATALAALGVGSDTRVGIQLSNLPQTVIAYYATL